MNHYKKNDHYYKNDYDYFNGGVESFSFLYK